MPGFRVVPYQCDDAEQHRRRAKDDPPAEHCFHTEQSNRSFPFPGLSAKRKKATENNRSFEYVIDAPDFRGKNCILKMSSKLSQASELPLDSYPCQKSSLSHLMLVSPGFGTISFSMVNSGVPNNSCGPSAVALKPNASYRQIARVKNGVVLRNSRAQFSSTATRSMCSSSSPPIQRLLAMGSTAIPRR